MFTPLWRILLRVTQLGPDTDLTCEEVMAVTDFLTETSFDEDSDNHLMQAAQNHLAHCPHCYRRVRRRLTRLEGKLTQTRQLPNPFM